MDLDALIDKVLKLQRHGFSIGIFGLLHPEFKKQIQDAREKSLLLGIDFRTKEFLGVFDNKLYGTYL
jgi:hypothetical protein